MRVSRADKSRVADWWFTVDHVLLAAIVVLIGSGLVLSLAASPAVALKKGLPAFYFVERQMLFAALGAGLMLLISFAGPRTVRRLALGLFFLALVAMVVVHLTGLELNGARRWLSIGGHSLQPSEFAKPAFVVLSAWLFAEAGRRNDVPASALAVASLLMLCGLLVAQPDVGQTVLVTLVWGALYFLAGQPVLGGVMLAGIGAAGLAVAYSALPHVQYRIDRFLAPGSGDNTQVERAMQSFAEGGFFGRGPGEGTIKSVLPDAHTDFIFAVVAEEYGVVACLALLALFAFIVLRAWWRVANEPDAAVRLGVQGLAFMFGVQAFINMAVNAGMLPAKGMTLPFISAGGSSTLAIAVTLGMLLALTRRRPDLQRLKKPRLVPTLDSVQVMGPKST